VAQVQAWCDDIATRHAAKVKARMGAVTHHTELRIIGQDSTLGRLETATPRLTEVGVMGIVTAADQDTARAIAMLLNPYLLHHPLTQQEEQPTFAFPFSPAEIDRGPVYAFALHHVMTLSDPMSAFRLDVLA
jgi:hypothetical protein